MIFDARKPTKTSINSVIPFNIGANKNGQARAGFVVGYESGHFRVYVKND
jgi:hypothetical protein